mgnify:CR=1 FL=1
MSNTNYKVLEMIQSRFGGAIVRKVPKGNRKVAYNLRLNGEVASNMLKSVKPFLVVKVEQAKLGIEFQDTMVGNPGNQYRTSLTDDTIEFRDYLLIKSRELNFRGIS